MVVKMPISREHNMFYDWTGSMFSVVYTYKQYENNRESRKLRIIKERLKNKYGDDKDELLHSLNYFVENQMAGYWIVDEVK